MLGSGIQGKTLGIVGLGKIGLATARRARAFGMEIAYAGRRRAPADVETELAARFLPLEELLAQADVVSLHCPLSAETRHLIDAEALGRMKPSAFLVNTTRGPVVDEAALADALRSGTIAGAGLDVFEREPEVHRGAARPRERGPHPAPRLGDGRDADGDGRSRSAERRRGARRRRGRHARRLAQLENSPICAQFPRAAADLWERASSRAHVSREGARWAKEGPSAGGAYARPLAHLSCWLRSAPSTPRRRMPTAGIRRAAPPAPSTSPCPARSGSTPTRLTWPPATSSPARRRSRTAAAARSARSPSRSTSRAALRSTATRARASASESTAARRRGRAGPGRGRSSAPAG